MEGECITCGHDFAPHILVPTQEDARKGGIIFCQEGDCDCVATWATKPYTKEDVLRPSDEEIVKIRAMFNEP